MTALGNDSPWRLYWLKDARFQTFEGASDSAGPPILPRLPLAPVRSGANDNPSVHSLVARD